MTVDAGILHDTMKRISAMELHDVPTLAFDDLVNEVECLFCSVAEEGAAKSSAKMLTNFGGPQAAVLDSIVLDSLLQLYITCNTRIT